MDIKVKGKQRLEGEVYPSGSKNSAVALLPATILFDKEVILENIPDITDVTRLVGIMEKLGSRIKWNKGTSKMKIDNSSLLFKRLNRSGLESMRGTSLLWGPMLARFGQVDFGDLPGGCTLGFRTLLPHYRALENLGVVIRENGNGIFMDAGKARSNKIWLSEMSPTATENVLMLAVGLKGKSQIIGAASEPQVQDLCHFLNAAGARISGIGSSVLTINGVKSLSKVQHSILTDHYEVATFLALGAVTGGSIKIHNALPSLFTKIDEVFTQFGVDICYDKKTAILCSQKGPRITNQNGRSILTIKAQPWPGLPVDMLPLFIPLALAAKNGHVLFHNWMYEAGLFWTSELNKLGANIIMCDPHRVIVFAGSKLRGAVLEAPYIIRSVVAMVMAAMIADGESLILNADVLYRGHPNFARNLRKLGAKIEEVL